MEGDPSEHLRKLSNLLRECAVFLAERRIVECPASVAVVRLDIEERLNRYCLLYDDWSDTVTSHPLFVEKHWGEKLEEFRKKRKREYPGGNIRHTRGERILQEFDRLVVDGEHLDIVKFISDQLKKTRFYCSVTEDVYMQAKRSGVVWSFADLTPILPTGLPDRKERKRAKDRSEFERANKCVGDWSLGIYLENLYLNSSRWPFYAEYFVRHPEENTVFAITACCGDQIKAEKIISIADKVSRTEFNANPFDVATKENLAPLKDELLAAVSAPASDLRPKYIMFREFVLGCDESETIRDLLAKKREYCSLNKSAIWPVVDAFEAYLEVTKLAAKRVTTPDAK